MQVARTAQRIGWLGTLAAPAMAVVLVVTAPRLSSLPAADEKQQHSFFVTLTSEERSMRKSAAKDFATDPWSQDDAFHNLEWKRILAISASNQESASSLLRALDEGLRAHWPRGSNDVRVTVPPCRPRPIY